MSPEESLSGHDEEESSLFALLEDEALAQFGSSIDFNRGIAANVGVLFLKKYEALDKFQW